eukprot:Skav218722  [mRNA]  locus=scaffold1346:741595:756173:+ [translate_table: standard]
MDSLDLHAALPSGQCATVSIQQSGTIGDLKKAVQESLDRPFLTLAAPDGHFLDDPMKSLEHAGLQDGNIIAVVALQPRVAATDLAFALWCVGSSRVVTWGEAVSGGDSSEVADQLKNVQQIYSTRNAFAAILADSTVVTWGYSENGGDSSEVTDQLINVEQISATSVAFAAILADGTVVTWGCAGRGGDSSEVTDQLIHVQQIYATWTAFAAILADGSVVTWGSADEGGDSSEVTDQLIHVQQIYATSGAFAAILADSTVVTWGRADRGGDSSEVTDQLINVEQISATSGAFAAILADGTVVTWGRADRGGDSSEVAHKLKNVQQIYSTWTAFAAILADGSVVTWGSADEGGDSSEVTDQLINVEQISATSVAFAAILADGTVVTWGRADRGGDSSGVADQLRKVQQIHGTERAFAAILADGTVVTWGNSDYGGDSSMVLSEPDVPGIVHMSKPSLLSSRLRQAEPSSMLRFDANGAMACPQWDHCGWHSPDGTGNWSCDLSKRPLRKLVSAEVEKDVVAQQFFSNFRVTGDAATAMGLILVAIQLLSLGLNRWADVVQTRNRGRTGGIRQARAATGDVHKVHRSEMIRKFMHLERSEYWEASDADWLYTAMFDVNVITNKAYFGVFVMAQSCFALLLSVLLVTGLAIWSSLEKDPPEPAPAPGKPPWGHGK